MLVLNQLVLELLVHGVQFGIKFANLGILLVGFLLEREDLSTELWEAERR